jgi:hypothetical protein
MEETALHFEPPIGLCAICSNPVSKTEDVIVEDFWRSFIVLNESDIYVDLVIDCQQLQESQFNQFHEPRLCLACLKQSIHREARPTE